MIYTFLVVKDVRLYLDDLHFLGSKGCEFVFVDEVSVIFLFDACLIAAQFTVQQRRMLLLNVMLKSTQQIGLLYRIVANVHISKKFIPDSLSYIFRFTDPLRVRKNVRQVNVKWLFVRVLFCSDTHVGNKTM